MLNFQKLYSGEGSMEGACPSPDYGNKVEHQGNAY